MVCWAQQDYVARSLCKTMPMKSMKERMAKGLATALLLPALWLAGCQHGATGAKDNPAHQGSPLTVLRFEQLMFGVTPSQLQDTLRKTATLYGGTLLNVRPNDPAYMAQLAGMAQDATCRELYDSVARHFADLKWLGQEMAHALRRTRALGDSTPAPKVVTFISGQLDYVHRAAANESSVLIALDQYVTPCFKKYGYFQLPSYLVALSTPAHMLPDAVAALARQHIAWPQGEPTLLDYMVAEGKVQYYLRRALPKCHDTLLLRYNASQWEWARAHASDAWAYWIQRDLLFEQDYNEIFNFIEDAPKTNAFGDSAPRMTDYVGWQIVEAYMEGHPCPLQQLLETSDARKILRESGWKPERKRR